jgi:hypothetical protein
MKRMTDSQKIAKLTQYALNYSFDQTRAVLLCPYGDQSHASPEKCPACSSLDGSECVDELLEAIDAFELDGVRIDSAIQRVRAWRAKR